MSQPRWQVLVPLKRLAEAKSRLSDDPEERRALAVAMARDTVEAVTASSCVAHVWVVTNEPDLPDALRLPGTTVVRQPPELDAAGDPLNAALVAALRRVASHHAGARVAIVAADLPALRTADLDEVLVTGAAHDAAVVADHTGSGTTVLLGASADRLTPAFGRASLDRHLLMGATSIEAALSVRLDVDTAADLQAALRIGVGSHTRDHLGHRARPLA